jgi:copper(I)-binding protein
VRVKPAMRRRIGVDRKMRNALIAMAAVVAALSTAGCAAGQQAATAHESAAIDGTGGTIGAIELHAVAIEPPPNGPSYPAGATAALTLIIVNDSTSDDALVGASASGAASVLLYASAADATAAGSSPPTPSSSTSPAGTTSGATPTGGSSTVSASTSPSSTGPQPLTSLAIPAGEHVAIAVNGTDMAMVLTGLLKPLFPGTTLSITFTFRSAGSITLSVPVQLTPGGAESPLVIPPGTAAP